MRVFDMCVCLTCVLCCRTECHACFALCARSSSAQVLLETGYADLHNLQPMYEAAAAAIRVVDSKHWIMYEPSTRDTQLFPFGSGFTQGSVYVTFFA